ncbi:L,D-transpeptidase [Rhodoplanes sp. TEM]|uniref:L,D-transpeptidase n=1 Tax=Rhodoplanes tepidamans TaxID=200616 RepID=A0ABT5J910_RHOTP|nr:MULTISPECIES: L,D-transpeptidase [Rhodoplanes]MDC7786102.1 L,D-transpeptidase [Rhodoplanes tepidamans]MDC7985624.1 L,D-transpeptidase [Rhodoplanes sp. TEM]MDQ0357234.1 lipoprotein-anchoring transpeptidase ErfK/SrfK [Rhodoplanes tepidamans]
MYRVLLCALAATALSGPPAAAQTWGSGSYGISGRSYVVPQTAVQAPVRRGSLGGGFVEAIFGGGEAPEMRARGYQAQEPAAYGGGRYAGIDPSELGRNAVDPRFRPQRVAYDGSEPAGTIVVDTRNFYLYLVEGNGRAMRYGVGVGRPGFTWSGAHTITGKKEWPDWRPPEEMLRRQPSLPSFMPGGPENPLGARALYLGDTLYRIHGSNEPWTIGTQVSSGCIRMRNEDVIDLYERVKVGARVVVI